MPTSAQCLYFHLGMHGDDDGFVASPRRITALCGCNPDDLKLLISKGFVYPFESGVCVIVDWRLNNTLKNDRYRPTIYTAEKALLEENVPCFQNGSKMVPQPNVTKRNITEPNVTESKAGKPRKRERFSPPTLDEVRSFCGENGYSVDAERFVSYYESQGWHVGRNPMRDWRAAVRSWASKDQKKGALPTDYGNPEDFYK